jgi:hypothetical protein
MKNTKVINLFGGPGAGKSTIASGLFYEFKIKDISCDNPYEFPKQVAWEDNLSQITDQLYILANQHRGLVRSYGKVDYIILDSPLLLSLLYKNGYTGNYPAQFYGESFDHMVLDLFNHYDNINIFLERPEKEFQVEGRFQDQDESLMLDNKLKDILYMYNIPYHSITVGENTVSDIMKLL